MDQIRTLLEHPYTKPILLVLLVVLVIYFYTRKPSQVGGALNEHQAINESATKGQTEPPTAVVLFFSPRCGHCEVLMPTWQQLEKKYQAHPDIMLDKVDCEAEPEAVQQFKIEGYPTILKLTKDGQRTEYNGKRDQQSIEAFINA